ncbi:hypothetical protein LINPERHAP2_LOCUS37152 [Linum perenne]
MSVQVELLVHHGGRMQFNGRAAQYVGGEVVEVTFDSDYLCYFQLMKIGTEDLKYDSVEKIWFVAPGMSLSDGLEQVLNDTDAEKIGEAGKKGVVEVYLDTTTVESGYGDNEEEQGCKWRVYASWFGRDEAFVIKAVGEPHTCPRPPTNRSANSKWIARRFLSRFKIDPEYNSKHLVREMMETYGIQVTNRVCVLAKIEAKRLLEGSLTEAYAKLRSYVLQLMKSDPEGRFVLEVDPVAGEEYVRFMRIYIGFSSLRKGFLIGCRKMFAVDGCFLKGEVKGMILTVVGKDGNNQMFPIAWAVVEGENHSSWGWFIEIIQEELNLGDGTGWSIISDQQKVEAVLTGLFKSC